MITAASTAVGSPENSGASATSVRSTSVPVTSEATGVQAPADSLSELAERLVETGIPWKTPEPRFALGIEAVLQGHPRDARIAEVLRHDERRDRDSRDRVAPQPPALVPRQPVDDRQQAADSPGRPIPGPVTGGGRARPES